MKALIVVDVQNDFLAGGALEVPQGDQVIPVINRLMPQYDYVVATQDWHPDGHKSFASSHAGKAVFQQIELNGLAQTLWPDHCVQGSEGAQFSAELLTHFFDEVVRKGIDPEVDSYSGFYDNGKVHSTGLTELFREKGVREVDVVGLATDYCVKFTALDALSDGFKVRVIKDACRGVNMVPGDVEASYKELEEAGAEVVASSERA